MTPDGPSPTTRHPGKQSTLPRIPRGAAALLGTISLACAAITARADEPTADASPEGPPEQAQAALTAPKAEHNRLLDVAVAGSRLVAVGEQGVILISDDGARWQQVPSPFNGMLSRLRFTDEQNGWALGYDGAILNTADGGKTWTLRHYDPKGRAVYDLLFVDAQRGMAVGAYGSFFDTTDGGRTWTRREFDLADLDMHLNTLLKLGDGSLFLAGERGLMARSADAGATWQVLDFPYAGSIFGAIPSGEKGVVVYGMRGNVFDARDVSACTTMDIANWDPYARESQEAPDRAAALGWRHLENPVRESLFGAVPGNGGAVIVGVNGTAVKLDAAHGALARVTTPATETLARVAVFKGRLIGVGRRGVQDLGAAP